MFSEGGKRKGNANIPRYQAKENINNLKCGSHGNGISVNLPVLLQLFMQRSEFRIGSLENRIGFRPHHIALPEHQVGFPAHHIGFPAHQVDLPVRQVGLPANQVGLLAQ